MADKVKTKRSLPAEYLDEDWEKTFRLTRGKWPAFFGCHICGWAFSSDSPEVDEGYYLWSGGQLPWWACQRTILYRRSDATYHLSESHSGYQGYRSLATVPVVINREKTQVQPLMYKPPKNKKRARASRWEGLPVHDHCWDLLSHHELGSIAERDLAMICPVLHHRRRMMGNQCKIWRRQRKDRCGPILLNYVVDLAFREAKLRQAKSRKVKSELSRSCRSTCSTRPEAAQKSSFTCKLPMELIYMIVGDLWPHTLANVEKAFGIDFDDKIWRSSVSAVPFLKTRAFTEEDIDWRKLAWKLEKELKGGLRFSMCSAISSLVSTRS
ncbi:hypothetical protein FE257_005055 [Aspergillus nanangensis]|uniref:Uncharacterized protein n=1 Tax=Aspergillus nanangensis TaxID=2582783 RepID=A0AAD4GUY1_ASPNN|nr:hypothetical protein FE257_005055 [Aspergillus nanangensis]